jgi:F-type H+-transporting ATPase subunit b
MENLILLSNNLRLNTNILETNVINIIILAAILFNVLGEALKVAMRERKQQILEKLQNVEKRIQEVKERSIELKTKTKQSKILVSKIYKKHMEDVTKRTEEPETRGLEELERKRNIMKSIIIYKNRQSLRDLKDQVSRAALINAVEFCQNKLRINTHIHLLNQTIESIGGQQWQAKF